MSDVKKQAKEQMKAAISHLEYELNGIRTGRANPSLLDSVSIEVYGTQMRLKDLSSVSSPEARQLLVTPFDTNNTGAIAKSIEKANLGFQVIAEGNSVRIIVPAMDEAMRKEMCKLVNKRKEEAKISIRNARRDCNDLVRKQKNDGDIPEDLMKSLEKIVQELTDQYCKEADEIAAAKEKDVMEI